MSTKHILVKDLRKIASGKQPLIIISSRDFKTTTENKSGHGIQMHQWWGPEQIIGREVVGSGFKNREIYEDRCDVWYPGIRFRKNDEIITPLRHKQLGDWKKLTLDEIKQLYRYDFCQTLSEFETQPEYGKVGWALAIGLCAISVLYVSLLRATSEL